MPCRGREENWYLGVDTPGEKEPLAVAWQWIPYAKPSLTPGSLCPQTQPFRTPENRKEAHGHKDILGNDTRNIILRKSCRISYALQPLFLPSGTRLKTMSSQRLLEASVWCWLCHRVSVFPQVQGISRALAWKSSRRLFLEHSQIANKKIYPEG